MRQILSVAISGAPLSGDIGRSSGCGLPSATGVVPMQTRAVVGIDVVDH
jgi:hypothetical protein